MNVPTVIDDALESTRTAQHLLEQLLQRIESDGDHYLLQLVLGYLDEVEEALVLRRFPQ